MRPGKWAATPVSQSRPRAGAGAAISAGNLCVTVVTYIGLRNMMVFMGGDELVPGGGAGEERGATGW